jgi:predicted ATPase/DNA-binding SARP family transcriptional activator
MRCRVLGPVELAVGDRPVPLASRHQRTILAVLLAAPGMAASTDRLIDALWPDAAPSGARKALQMHVTRLRRRLAREAGSRPDLVQTTPDGYRIQLAGHELDSRQFEDLLTRAGSADPAHAAPMLEAGLALWRGPAYGDLSAHPMLQADAGRLDELRTRAALDRVDALLALGLHDDVIPELGREVVAGPLRERPHGQLMLALYRAGRAGEALSAFQRLRRRLADELGVSPAPSLQQLHTRILRQDPSLLPPPASPHGVAPERAPLVGRDSEITAVSRLLDQTALVTLTGPGGVGKTRLAQAVAAHLAGRYDQGAVMVELAPVRAADAVDHAVAAALDVGEGPGPPRDRLVRTLLGRQLLLVVDNCEHLLPQVAELVDHLVRRCPELAVLATSRHRLAVSAEQLFPVAPLPVPAADDLASADVLASNPAVRLFSRRAVAADPGFILTGTNAATVAEICRRLDGLPLALELAASRTAAMNVQDLAVRLDRPFGLLADDPARDGGRSRGLDEVVGWSYSLLDPPAKVLFDRISVFAGGFTLDSAEQVCGGGDLPPVAVARALTALVDSSLVQRRDRRYHLLETVREYARARLAARGETDGLSRAHATSFAALVDQAAAGARGPDGATWISRLNEERDNLRAAVHWAAAQRYADLTLRLFAPLAQDAFSWLGEEVVTWAELAAALPEARGHPLLPLGYGAAACAAVFQGRFERCRQLADLGLQAAPDRDDPRRLAPLFAFGLAALFQGRFDEADTSLTGALRHARATGDAYHMIFARIGQAMVATYRPEPDPGTATALAAQACQEAEELGNPQARAFAYYTRGEALAAHDPREAADWLERSLSLTSTVPVRSVEAMALLSLSTIRARQDDVAAALTTMRQAVDRWRRAGMWAHQWTTVRNLIFLLTQLGEDEAAATLIGGVQASSTAAAAYGADAERMAAAEARLRGRLGGHRYETRWLLGKQMCERDVVAYALAAIDAAAARRPG